MTQEKEEVLSRAQLTKKVRSLKKKLRELKKSADISVEVLEKRVADMTRTQETLMHNLRRVMRELDLKPERPGR